MKKCETAWWKCHHHIYRVRSTPAGNTITIPFLIVLLCKKRVLQSVNFLIIARTKITFPRGTLDQDADTSLQNSMASKRKTGRKKKQLFDHSFLNWYTRDM